MKEILRTKLEYRCEKSREFNYGLCDWYTRYSRSYDMIVSASSKEECQRVMNSFEDKIRYYGIQESFDGNLVPEYDAKKKLWVGLVEIWIDNNSVTEDKELIKGIYKEWKDELNNKKDNMQSLIKEIRTLSSGTLVSISKEAKLVSGEVTYCELDSLRDEWMDFVEEIKDDSESWVQSWKKFTDHKIEQQITQLSKEIRKRNTAKDVLDYLVRSESNESWYLDYFIDSTGVGSAVLNGKTTVVFKMDAEYNIEVLGGDRIAYGDWFDLDLDDEHLIESAKKLQDILKSIKEKEHSLYYEGIYRVYPVESCVVKERKEIVGKFYEYGGDKWIGIDKSTGDCIVQEFKSLVECLAWLNGEIFECYKCGEIDAPLFSIYVEFKDGTDYSEIIGSDYTPEEVEEYIINLIEDNKWKDEVVDSSYGLYCPYCLNTLE